MKKLLTVLMLVLLLTFVVGIASTVMAGDTPEAIPMFGHHCQGNIPVGQSALLMWLRFCVFVF